MTSRRRLAARRAALEALATIDRIDVMVCPEGGRLERKEDALVALAKALDVLYGPLPPPTVFEEAARAWHAEDNPRSRTREDDE